MKPLFYEFWTYSSSPEAEMEPQNVEKSKLSNIKVIRQPAKFSGRWNQTCYELEPNSSLKLK